METQSRELRLPSNVTVINLCKPTETGALCNQFADHFEGWLSPINPKFVDGSSAWHMAANTPAGDVSAASYIAQLLLTIGVVCRQGTANLVPRWLKDTHDRAAYRNAGGRLTVKQAVDQSASIAPEIIVLVVDQKSVAPERARELLQSISSVTWSFPVVVVVAISDGRSTDFPGADEPMRVNNISFIRSPMTEIARNVMSVLGSRVNSLTNKPSYQLRHPKTAFRPSPFVVSLSDPPFRSELKFSHGIGNNHLSTHLAGNPAVPSTQSMRTAYPSDEVKQSIVDYLYACEVRRAIESFTGYSRYAFLNARPYLSLPGDYSKSGAHSWHRDYNPQGICRGILYLTPVQDVSSGPFTYAQPSTATNVDEVEFEKIVLGDRGTLILFDGNAILHKGGLPTTQSRAVLDLSFIEIFPHEKEGVYFLGVNNWPSDRDALHYFNHLLVSPRV